MTGPRTEKPANSEAAEFSCTPARTLCNASERKVCVSVAVFLSTATSLYSCSPSPEFVLCGGIAAWRGDQVLGKVSNKGPRIRPRVSGLGVCFRTQIPTRRPHPSQVNAKHLVVPITSVPLYSSRSGCTRRSSYVADRDVVSVAMLAAVLAAGSSRISEQTVVACVGVLRPWPTQVTL